MFKHSINLPDNINIIYKNNILYIKGLKNQTYLPILKFIQIYKLNNTIYLNLKKDNNLNISIKKQKLLLNTCYTSLINKIQGVSIGYFNVLKLVGLGYKVKIKDNFIILKLGFSHDVKITMPKQIKIFCSNNQTIVFFCTDKVLLSQFISKIKNLKKIDNYKGKGILYINEIVKLKEGKKN